MNCSVFGKTQEKLRNRVNGELTTKEEILEKRIANPKFKRGAEITATSNSSTRRIFVNDKMTSKGTKASVKKDQHYVVHVVVAS